MVSAQCLNWHYLRQQTQHKRKGRSGLLITPMQAISVCVPHMYTPATPLIGLQAHHVNGSHRLGAGRRAPRACLGLAHIWQPKTPCQAPTHRAAQPRCTQTAQGGSRLPRVAFWAQERCPLFCLAGAWIALARVLPPRAVSSSMVFLRWTQPVLARC